MTRSVERYSSEGYSCISLISMMGAVNWRIRHKDGVWQESFRNAPWIPTTQDACQARIDGWLGLAGSGTEVPQSVWAKHQQLKAK